MKPVSFSLGGVSEAVLPVKSKKVHDAVEETVKESIVEFSVRDPEATAREKKSAERKVIPSKPNRLTSKKKDEDPNALGKLEDRFEKATVQQTVGDGVYGLVSGSKAEKPEHTGTAKLASKMAGLTDDLPDAPTTEYEDMPVDQFATALLRGMGMTKHHVVSTVELVARPSRMGLGAKVGDMNTKKRSYKELVGADGSAKSIIREGEKVIDKATLGPRVGKQMKVEEGRHQGLKCIVRELQVGGNEDKVHVTLLPSEKDAIVAYSCLTEPGMRPQGPAEASQKPESGATGTSSRYTAATYGLQERTGAAQASLGDPGDRAGKGAQHNGANGRSHLREASELGAGQGRNSGGAKTDDSRKQRRHEARRCKSWLREGLRVRVVSHSLNRGTAYLSKAVIMNVLGHALCSIKLDSGPVLDDVYEEDLETVVSKRAGASLMVVRGSHCGEHARLVEKTKGGVAVVQLVDSGEAVQLGLDDVADYVGGDGGW